LNAHSVSGVRRIEIHTAEPLVPDPIPFKVEIATAKLKRYKSPYGDQIPAKPIQARGSKIHKIINSIWNKEDVPDQWKEFIILPVHEKGDKTESSNCRGLSLLSVSYKIHLISFP
jgi:hypothetical protein